MILTITAVSSLHQTMKNDFIKQSKIKKFFIVVVLFLASAQMFELAAQTKKAKSVKKTAVAGKTKIDGAANSSQLKKVRQIDAAALGNLIKRDAAHPKPLLINFWATWCAPCREEFPDLVRINNDYKGKIDFIIVSLDDLAEIKRDVPKFLDEFKAEMPAYLLKTADNEAAIAAAVSKNWQGGLPFTVLFDETGEIVYNRQGKVAPEVLRGAIEKLLSAQAAK